MSRAIGNNKERDALTYLKKQGLKLVTQNYHTRSGEIDLIMRDKNILVFIEVRLRKNQHYGNSLESITYSKQQKLIKTAEHYLLAHPSKHLDYRFDVIAIDQLPETSIMWVQNVMGI